jgi:hypothetical protein
MGVTRGGGFLTWCVAGSLILTAGSAAARAQVIRFDDGSLQGPVGGHDGFGCSTAFQDHHLFVAAPRVDARDGAVYVYEGSVGGGWQLVQTLRPSSNEQEELFGSHVHVSGDRLVVGATGFTKDVGLGSGSVYIFDRAPGGEWVEFERVSPDVFTGGDRFGCSMWLDGELLLVGAPDEKIGGQDWGAAYLFAPESDGHMVIARKLVSPGALHAFGEHVFLRDGVMIIAAPLAPEAGAFSGALYVYHDIGGDWMLAQTVVPLDAKPRQYFGMSMAVSGSTVLAGTGDEAAGLAFAGRVHVFDLSAEGVMTQTDILTAPDPVGWEAFGTSVSLAGDRALVGTCPNTHDFGHGSGRAIIFERVGSGWTAVYALHREVGTPDDWFGCTVGMAEDLALVSAPSIRVGSTEPGTVYLYDLSPCGADCTGDGALDVFDFLCFHGRVMTSDPAADCNGDGLINIFDFLCFHAMTVAGCG